MFMHLLTETERGSPRSAAAVQIVVVVCDSAQAIMVKRRIAHHCRTGSQRAFEMWSSGWAIWVAGRRAIPAGDGSNTNETYSTMVRYAVMEGLYVPVLGLEGLGNARKYSESSHLITLIVFSYRKPWYLEMFTHRLFRVLFCSTSCRALHCWEFYAPTYPCAQLGGLQLLHCATGSAFGHHASN